MKRRVANLTKRNIETFMPESKPYRVWDNGGKESVKGLMIRVQPTGSMSYYFYYRNEHGKAINYRIGNGGDDGLSPAQARDAAKLKAGEVAVGTDVQAEKAEKRQQDANAKLKTLRGFIDNKYRDWCVTEYKTGKQTIQAIEKQFEHLLDKQMAEITDWDITAWRSREKKKGRRDGGINRQLAALKGCLSRAVQWDVIPSHRLTVKSKQVKVDNARVRFLDDAEELALRNALDEREQEMRDARAGVNEWRRSHGYKLHPDISNTEFSDYLKPLVLLSINTGCRRGELFSLTWKAVSFRQKQITIFASTAKAEKTRHIPLNAEALAALKGWQQQAGKNALVFPNPKTGERFDNIKKAWGKIVVHAGLDDFHWHDLRHTFASNLVMAGVDLNTVRELMGHADIKMTLRYAHLASGHKSAAVDKLTAPQSAKVIKIA